MGARGSGVGFSRSTDSFSSALYYRYCLVAHSTPNINVFSQAVGMVVFIPLKFEVHFLEANTSENIKATTHNVH